MGLKAWRQPVDVAPMKVPPLDERLAPEFKLALARFDLTRLELDPNAGYGVASDGRIVYLNPAWFHVAEQSHATRSLAGWGIGRNALEAFGPLRQRYEALFAKARESGQPLQQLYSCRTGLQRRDFMMRVLPLGGDFVLVHNTLIECTPETEASFNLSADYVSRDGLIVACANCRRVKHQGHAERWDWVPALLSDVARIAPLDRPVSHSVCEPCLGFYYPPL